MKKIFVRLLSLSAVVALVFTNSSLFAYQINRLDSFDIGSGFDIAPEVIAIQNDGKIIVGGSFSVYKGISYNKILRLNSDGSVDSSFDIGDGFDSNVGSIVIQNDGKIMVGGWFTTYKGVSVNKIVRLNADGSIDPTFTLDTVYDATHGYIFYINNIVVLPNGKYFIGGDFGSNGGVNPKGIAKLNSDGSLDKSFVSTVDYDGLVADSPLILVQPDGKILVGGDLSYYQGNAVNELIRLNADGSRDFSFDIGAGFDNSLLTILLQSDGKILASGRFTTYQGSSANRIIRLNPDGSRDNSFNIGAGFNSEVAMISLDKNGKILVGGFFTTYKGLSADYLVRLNTDGSLDSGFDIGAGFDIAIYSLNLNRDGNLFVGGYLTTDNNNPIAFAVLETTPPVVIPNTTNTTTIQTEFVEKGYIATGSVFSGSTSISLRQTNGQIPTSLTLTNQNSKLMLPQNIQFKKEDNITNYTGVIVPPTPVAISTINSSPVISAVKVGSSTEPLKLTSGVATLQLPAPGKSVGDKVNIYSSEDQTSWSSMGVGIVSLVDGQPYVTFTTDHFSYFAIGQYAGSFVIDNDVASTTSQTVALTIDAPSALQMRFSNDGSSWSTWETYATSKSRTLSAGVGMKTVYAQFDTNNDSVADASTSDTIQYSMSAVHGAAQGDISLNILSGSSSCEYGTVINLGRQTIGSNFGSMVFSGDFLTHSGSSSWECTDFAGTPAGWNLTIQTTDLSNEANNIISGSNVKISHSIPTLLGGNCGIGGTGALDQSIATTHVILSKQPSTERSICRISTSSVQLKVDVPANQAPGTYIGTLTVTLPTFN